MTIAHLTAAYDRFAAHWWEGVVIVVFGLMGLRTAARYGDRQHAADADATSPQMGGGLRRFAGRRLTTGGARLLWFVVSALMLAFGVYVIAVAR